MARSGTAVHPRLRRAADETWLTSAAARGDLGAFAALLERYEARTFNLAFRILDSEEEAADVTHAAFLEAFRGLREGSPPHAVSFAVALASAASEGSFAAIEERDGSRPRGARDAAAGDAAGRLDDRDGGFRLEDWHERMRSANGRLPALGRQVLALRELAGLSYGAIAEVMDTDPDSVAELIALARLDLRDDLRGSDLAAREGPSEECSRAAPLIAMRDDDELDGHSHDAEWLIGHLVSCRDCRTRLDAMQEARLSYAAWDPIGPPRWLRRETLAQAASIAVPGEGSGARARLANGAAVRAEAIPWRDRSASGAHAGGGGPALAASGALALAASKIGAIARGTTASRAAAGPAALAREISGRASKAAAAAARKRPSSILPAPERRSRRRREALLAGGWAAVVALGVLALAVGGVFDTAGGDHAAPKPATPAAFERVTPPAPQPKPRPAARRKKRKRAVVAAPPAPQEVRPVPVVAPPPVTPQRRPTGEERRQTRRPRRESSSPRRTPPRAKVTPKAPANPQVPQKTEPPPTPGATPAPTTQAPTGCANPAGNPTPCPQG